MKGRVLILTLLAVFAVASTAPTGQTKSAKIVEFTATETFNPFGVPVPGLPTIGELVSPGTVKCPGGEPTGDPPQCPPGGRTHTRNTEFVSRMESDNDYINGWATVVGNGNLDAEFTGPQWGTFTLAPDAVDGTWEGTWQGVRVKEGDVWVTELHATARGSGGEIDGMTLLVNDRIVGFTAIPIAYTGEITGRIIEARAH